MAIKFLQDYVTKATPPEAFKLGQVAKDRGEASEERFVIRGIAAYLRDGKLFNAKGDEVEDPAPGRAEKDDEPLDYERDKLAEVDIARATKPQLLVIAKHEEVELPKGDDTTVVELRKAIEAKRKLAA